MKTAHGVTHACPCHVSGKHLSDAANEPEPTAEQIEQRNDARAFDLQIRAMDVQDRVNRSGSNERN
jgi:hypothetical protein